VECGGDISLSLSLSARRLQRGMVAGVAGAAATHLRRAAGKLFTVASLPENFAHSKHAAKRGSKDAGIGNTIRLEDSRLYMFP
jgi:hypothetical protein